MKKQNEPLSTWGSWGPWERGLRLLSNLSSAKLPKLQGTLATQSNSAALGTRLQTQCLSSLWLLLETATSYLVLSHKLTWTLKKITAASSPVEFNPLDELAGQNDLFYRKGRVEIKVAVEPRALGRNWVKRASGPDSSSCGKPRHLHSTFDYASQLQPA